MVWKKEFAIMPLFVLHVLNFFEPLCPHALNRKSRDVEDPLTNSFLSGSKSSLCWGWCRIFRATQYQDWDYSDL